MALTKVTYAMIADAATNVQDYGAVGDGVTNDAVAIQATIDAIDAQGGGTLFFPKGVYVLNSGITLCSSLTILGENGSIIRQSDSVPQWAIRGVSVNNVVFDTIQIESTGTAFTDGNQRLLQIESGSNLELLNCTFYNARSLGVVFDACTNVKVSNITAKNNYATGLTFRNQCGAVTITNSYFYSNGNTTVATGSFGRGLLIWQSANCTVTGCVFEDNTEYGLRLYSEIADTVGNRNIAISGCTFRNNGTIATSKIDLFLYDESGRIERVAIAGCTFNTRTGNTAVAVQGKNVSLTGCVFKAITPQTSTGVALFGSDNTVVSGCVFTNVALAVTYSSTEIPTNCTIANNQCIDVVQFNNDVFGTGHIINGNYIKHGGAGVSDVGILIIRADTDLVVSNNVIDGFYRGINVASTGGYITFQNNTTLNSDDSGFYALFQTDVTKFTCTNNNFDKSFPAVWGTIFSDGIQTFARKQWLFTAPPSTGGINGGANVTWKVGDRVYNSAATVGQPKAWVCTVAGAPGTWTSEGNL